jgi:D-sedoheptulose 7-phosphate isomerase
MKLKAGSLFVTQFQLEDWKEIMTTDDILISELEAHIAALRLIVTECKGEISKIIDFVIDCFRRGNKLLLCGNGGSAADAQHIAAEFVNRFQFDRPPLPAIALTTDSSILTCIGNDGCFEEIFSRQVDALAHKGDILVAISTSGQSSNVLLALKAAHQKGVITIGFTGENGRKSMSPLCDYCLIVSSTDTARIQECHEFIWHVICKIVEERLFDKT